MRPEVGELIISWAAGALSYDLSVKTSEVVDIYGAVCASREACLHQLVVFVKVGAVECAAELVVDEILPGHS